LFSLEPGSDKKIHELQLASALAVTIKTFVESQITVALNGQC